MNIFMDSDSISEKTLEKLETFSQNFLSHLWIRRKNPIYISIEIEEQGDVDDAVAYCMQSDDDACEIGIASHIFDDEDYLFETLAHELVHVKQYVKGELKQNSRGTVWKGEEQMPLISLCKALGVELTEEMYKSQPWEEEAYRDQALYKNFL
jgi:hypothetical protein